jgi:hypothetical protein
MSTFTPFRKQPNDYGGSSYQQRSNASFGRGRGRAQQNSNNVYSWKSVSSNSNNSLRPQWTESKDKSRW